jgi:hypothetical protein
VQPLPFLGPAVAVPTILSPVEPFLGYTRRTLYSDYDMPILSIEDNCKSPPGSLYPYITSNPPVNVCPQSILWTFCSGCPGLLSEDGTVELLKLHVLLAGSCRCSTDASLAGFGTTLTMECLNRLAQSLAPGLLAFSHSSSFGRAVDAVKKAASQLRSPPTIKASDLILPEAGAHDNGLASLLKLGTGNGPTLKFWIASLLAEGAGLVADRLHCSNPTLEYIDVDTFGRLVPEHLRCMTAVNDATLQTIWPLFLSFPYLPYPAVPLSLQEFIAFAGDDMGMQKEVPEVLNRLLHQTINAMIPPAQLLLRLCAGVQDSHVVTVIEALRSVAACAVAVCFFNQGRTNAQT